MSTPAKTIRICTAGHRYGYAASLPPDRCPECGKEWQEPPKTYDDQGLGIPKAKEAA